MATRIKVKYKDWLSFHHNVKDMQIDEFAYFNKVTFFYSKKDFTKCNYCIIEIRKFKEFVSFCMRNKLALHYEVV